MKKIISSIITIVIIASVLNYINNYHVCDFRVTYTNYGDCQTKGYVIKKCYGCDEEKRESLPYGDHQEVVVIQEKPSTCLEGGFTKQTKCSLCDVIVRESTPLQPLGHSEITVSDGYDPTCTEEGRTNSKKCQRCQIVLQESSTIAPLGHSEITVSDGYDPTCTEEGRTNSKKCERCDTTLQESTAIDELGHSDANENGFCDECNVVYGEHVTKITTVQDLKNIANKLDGAYMLMNDLDLTGETWTPIGDSNNKFTGALMGQGFKISGLSFTNRDSFGLFGYNAGVISNLTITNSKATLIKNSSTFGFLCALNDGKIENCTIEGNNVITIIAQNIKMEQNSDFDGSKEEVSITAGQICAINNGEISNCVLKDTLSITLTSNAYYQLNSTEPNGYKLESILNIDFGKVAGQNTGKISGIDCDNSSNNVTLNVEARENGDKGLAVSKINGSVGSVVGVNDGEIVSSLANALTISKSIIEDGVESIGGYDIGGISEVNLTECEDYTYVIGKNNGTVTA